MKVNPLYPIGKEKKSIYHGTIWWEKKLLNKKEFKNDSHHKEKIKSFQDSKNITIVLCNIWWLCSFSSPLECNCVCPAFPVMLVEITPTAWPVWWMPAVGGAPAPVSVPEGRQGPPIPLPGVAQTRTLYWLPTPENATPALTTLTASPVHRYFLSGQGWGVRGRG